MASTTLFDDVVMLYDLEEKGRNPNVSSEDLKLELERLDNRVGAHMTNYRF